MCLRPLPEPAREVEDGPPHLQRERVGVAARRGLGVDADDVLGARRADEGPATFMGCGERVDGWLRTTLRTEEPLQQTARSVTGGDLIAAAAAGDLEALRRASPSGVDEGNFDGRTCLHLAASNGRLDVVACLVDELGASTNVVDRSGGTPLDDAVRHSHSDVKEFLEGKGAMRGVSQPGEWDEGADLCDAAVKGDISRLRRLALQKQKGCNQAD